MKTKPGDFAIVVGEHTDRHGDLVKVIRTFPAPDGKEAKVMIVRGSRDEGMIVYVKAMLLKPAMWITEEQFENMQNAIDQAYKLLKEFMLDQMAELYSDVVIDESEYDHVVALMANALGGMEELEDAATGV